MPGMMAFRFGPVLALLLTAACAPTAPELRPDTPGEDPALAAATALSQAGQHAEAARAYLALVQQKPDQAALLRILAAEAWLEAGDDTAAAESLRNIDTTSLELSERARLDLARAELAMMRGRLANAGWLLAASAEHLTPELTERHAELERRLAQLEAQPARASVNALLEAIDSGHFEPEMSLALLIEHPLAELETTLLDVAGHTEAMPWFDLVISAREVLLDDDRLDEALAAWQRRWPDAAFDAAAARRWIAAWRQTRPLPERIAVMLPDRNSPLHAPGQAVREGLLAGWLALPPTRRPRLEFHALPAAEGAVIPVWFDARETGADFLIGPLDRRHVNTLWAMPDAGLIPTLLLNRPDRTDDLPFGSLNTLALPPEEEAEMLAIEALATGHRRAVILAQYSDWGERVARAFSETFTLGGGTVVEDRIYDPAASDHSYLLRDALQVDRSEARIARLQRIIGDELEAVEQRRTDIDLIFLAARASDGRQIRPQLNFFGAADITVMAPSYIVDGAPEPGRDGDLDGIVTPLPPWFIDTTAAGALRQRALTLFPELDNATLSRLHALGRDAMALVPWLDLMQADPALYLPGMLGRLNLADGVHIQRQVRPVQIRSGRAQPWP